ncbi:deoxycytidylate deaminase [Arcobacter porcinus]|uniref:Deoxycytidylate deaminase n=1 Tax=Arcobacter porcinus TaxID=1935204 RepID=A0A1C0AXC1_9BACT|nr:dCMP deaminase family protein [Arcobacter porcinus]OCL97335.1 Riboflavin biosynthesis protein RibD [Aliarcobacter thereius]OCL84241.1 Riboflavin biosynthesis protein RibD [Arcobacter porcinus]OCL84761.1 Riboflavin biosynthesis protein RibD [Arcobacter porcinus]OCL89305.1 Riboflavin biosynthesis protein RibD [Arcobacter porcinus]OCL91725.1 Riboflavin biosynthesis protein RibD [Arcobacter porcinus]
MIDDKTFINIAKEIAKSSKCVSKQVGAVIVKDGRILSTGYNGTPSGFQNCCDFWNNEYTKDHHEWSKTYEIHAEMNAIIWAARKGIAIEGATIYVTLEPCSDCSKNLIASGIKRIVYDKSYEHTNSNVVSKFLKDNGVIIEQIA